jgi:hypothetical protein
MALAAVGPCVHGRHGTWEHQASGKSGLIIGHILSRLQGDLSSMMSDIYNTLR